MFSFKYVKSRLFQTNDKTFVFLTTISSEQKMRLIILKHENYKASGLPKMAVNKLLDLLGEVHT